jgi:hypothetical protein
MLKHQLLLCNDKTNHLPMILELVVGMPIMCTKNNFGPKEVINNTLGHVIGYQKLQLLIIKSLMKLLGI